MFPRVQNRKTPFAHPPSAAPPVRLFGRQRIQSPSQWPWVPLSPIPKTRVKSHHRPLRWTSTPSRIRLTQSPPYNPHRHPPTRLSSMDSFANAHSFLARLAKESYPFPHSHRASIPMGACSFFRQCCERAFRHGKFAQRRLLVVKKRQLNR